MPKLVGYVIFQLHKSRDSCHKTRISKANLFLLDEQLMNQNKRPLLFVHSAARFLHRKLESPPSSSWGCAEGPRPLLYLDVHSVGVHLWVCESVCAQIANDFSFPAVIRALIMNDINTSSPALRDQNHSFPSKPWIKCFSVLKRSFCPRVQPHTPPWTHGAVLLTQDYKLILKPKWPEKPLCVRTGQSWMNGKGK